MLQVRILPSTHTALAQWQRHQAQDLASVSSNLTGGTKEDQWLVAHLVRAVA